MQERKCIDDILANVQIDKAVEFAVVGYTHGSVYPTAVDPTVLSKDIT